MIHRGVVRHSVVELEDRVLLPDGLEVQVVVEDSRGAESAPCVHRKGSPQAVLGAFDTPARCTPEDVDVLARSMDSGKCPVRFKGVFDGEDSA